MEGEYSALRRNQHLLGRLSYEDLYPHLVGKVSLGTLEEDVSMWHYLTGWHWFEKNRGWENDSEG